MGWNGPRKLPGAMLGRSIGAGPEIVADGSTAAIWLGER
jgi:hypothetical protein